MPKSNKENFEETHAGIQSQPLLPATRNDPDPAPRPAETLEKYRNLEDKTAKERRLRALWKALPTTSDEIIQWNGNSQSHNGTPTADEKEAERIQKLRSIYNQ